MYSKEEIERKRLQALERNKQKFASSPANTNSNFNSPSVSYNSSNQNNTWNSNSNNGYKSNFKNSNFQTKSQRVFKQQAVNNRFQPMSRSNDFYNKQQSSVKPSCEATCTMISSTRFAVDMSCYNQKLIELFKSVPTRLYDTQTKIWNFHLVDYEILQQKVISLKSEVNFKGLHSFVLKTFKSLLSKDTEMKKIDLSSFDKSFLNSLYPFQKEGIKYGILKNGKCLIADDMGLGKTRQAIGIAYYYKNDWPLIVITPSSVRYQWSEAIIESLPSVPVQEIQHLTSAKDYIEKSQITIISYDLLARRIDEIAARKYGVVICDESHYLKSSKTQRSKAVQRLATHCQRIILLTGTPALSRPMELYPQIRLVMPAFMSLKDFGMRYCAGTQTKFGWDFNGSSNSKELELLLKACCIIRRLKSEVMTQLPSKIRQKIILDPDLVKAATKEMEEASKELENEKNGQIKHSKLLQYYSVSSKAKEKAVCNYIADIIENEQKFLVFAHHKNMLDAICNLLSSKKVMFIRIDGHTNAEQRKYFVDQFQEEKKVLVAVLSITAANAGITMTAAQLVIFAELFWNPGILCQAEDRVHRIGQTDNVVIRYLLAKETVDDYLWPAIQKKIDVLNEVGLDQNLDLKDADVENQASVATNQLTDNQSKIDDFFTSPSKSTNSNVNPAGNADLSSENLKDLLNVDDDAFNDIDLDNIV